MTKRFIYDGLHIRDSHGKIPPILTNNDKIRDKYLNELNELHEEKEQVRNVLKKYLDYYTERAVLLKEPYGDVTEVIHDIANELGVDL